MLRRIASMAAASAVSLTLVCGFSGCGGGGGPTAKGEKARVDASGKVNFGGAPIPAGTVTFLNHETGNMAICAIDDGYYESDSDGGPNPGRNSVQIVGKESEEANPMWAGAWSIEVDVGANEFTKDFDVPKDEVQPFDPKSIRIDD